MSTTSSLSSWLSSSRFFSSVSSHSPTSLSSFASSYWPWRALILLLSLYLWWCPHFPFFFTLPLYFLISSAGSASLSLLSVWWRKVVVVRRGYNSWWRGGLWFVTIFYGMCCQKSRKVHNSGCQFSNIQYEAVQDDVGTRHRNSLKNVIMVTMTLQFLTHHGTYINQEKCPFLMMMSSKYVLVIWLDDII